MSVLILYRQVLCWGCWGFRDASPCFALVHRKKKSDDEEYDGEDYGEEGYDDYDEDDYSEYDEE